MKTSDVINALDLPPNVIVGRRIPKSTILEQAKLTAADKRLLTEEIKELRWEASLKETTTGIAACSDDQHDYGEVVVLSAHLRPSTRAARLLLLIHRAIPYHVLLVAGQDGEQSDAEQDNPVTVSLATKRRSQAENDTFVIDGDPIEIELTLADQPALPEAFLESLALSGRPRHTFRDLYTGWIEAVEALHAARVTGTFTLPGDADRAATRRADLAEYERIEAELAQLRRQLAKERQMRRQVDLNAEIKRLKNEYASLRGRL